VTDRQTDKHVRCTTAEAALMHSIARTKQCVKVLKNTIVKEKGKMWRMGLMRMERVKQAIIFVRPNHSIDNDEKHKGTLPEKKPYSREG